MLAATPPPVPIAVQHAIALRTPQLGFVPARVPTGYRYLKWRWAETSATLRVWFRNTSGKQIVFISTWQYGSCAQGKEKTFQLAGTKVYWNHDAKEQQAWRCLPAAGIQIELTTATSQSPKAFADVGLGRVSASAHKIR